GAGLPASPPGLPAMGQPAADITATSEPSAPSLVSGFSTNLQPSPAPPTPLATATGQALSPDTSSSAQEVLSTRQVQDAVFEQWNDWALDVLAGTLGKDE